MRIRNFILFFIFLFFPVSRDHGDMGTSYQHPYSYWFPYSNTTNQTYNWKNQNNTNQYWTCLPIMAHSTWVFSSVQLLSVMVRTTTLTRDLYELLYIFASLIHKLVFTYCQPKRTLTSYTRVWTVMNYTMLDESHGHWHMSMSRETEAAPGNPLEDSWWARR